MRGGGFLPRARHHADDFVTVLTLVAAGQGVAVVPELALRPPSSPPGQAATTVAADGATPVAPDGVVLTPLRTRRRTRFAYRAGTGAHPSIAAFTAAVRAA
ncbi:hypothetical protein GCM10027610_046770 [Dactylosporangium cerinum]